MSTGGAAHQVEDGVGKRSHSQYWVDAAEVGSGVPAAGRDGNASESDAASPVLPIVPLEPFLMMMQGGHGYDSVNHRVAGHVGVSKDTAEVRQGPARLTHDVSTLLDERLSRSGSRGEARNEDERGGPASTTGPEGVCGSLHLIVDGVVFQVEAARPGPITRVWENVLPAVSERSILRSI